MPNPRIQDIFQKLSFERKILVTGAFLMVISLFFPWYQDVDTFQFGNTYTGLNTPLYLIGLSFLGLSILTVALIASEQIRGKNSTLKIPHGKIYLFTGLFSFYQLFLATTIYFDKNFGVNIALKQSQFGMFSAYIAAALLTIGGYIALSSKKAVMDAFEEETRPHVNVATAKNMPAKTPKMQLPNLSSMNQSRGDYNDQRKPKENLRTVYPRPQMSQPAPSAAVSAPNINVPHTPLTIRNPQHGLNTSSMTVEEAQAQHEAVTKAEATHHSTEVYEIPIIREEEQIIVNKQQ